MTEPRGPARDSSRQDRKAPGNCLLRTPQPRPGNVMRNDAGRYFGLQRLTSAQLRNVAKPLAAKPLPAGRAPDHAANAAAFVTEGLVAPALGSGVSQQAGSIDTVA